MDNECVEFEADEKGMLNMGTYIAALVRQSIKYKTVFKGRIYLVYTTGGF